MNATESTYWPTTCEAWRARAAALGLRPGTKRYIDQQEAFLQGALAVATATGVMTHERASMLGFLVLCGRIDMVLPPKAPTPAPAEPTPAQTQPSA